jgi:ribosomal protein L11
MEFNGTLQILVYAADVNMSDTNTNAIKKNTETLLGAGREVGLEVNIGKTKTGRPVSN